jgi:hypothetical protein
MVRSIQDRIASPNPKMPLVTDGEVIMQAGTKFKVLKETQQEDVLIFYVEEL